jgi:hypothetical protein
MKLEQHGHADVTARLWEVGDGVKGVIVRATTAEVERREK